MDKTGDETEYLERLERERDRLLEEVRELQHLVAPERMREVEQGPVSVTETRPYSPPTRVVPVTMELPAHEHSRLADAARAEAKPMKHLARECMAIGLLVKRAYRDGDEVGVVGPTGRVRMRIGP